MPQSDSHASHPGRFARQFTLVILLLISGFPPVQAQPPAPQPPPLFIPPVSPPPAIGPEQETQLPEHATEFLKGMALLLLPDAYSDDDDWGAQKQVQSGLNVRMDGLKLDTSRRWKMVNHGLWQRIDAQLVDPEQHLQLSIWLLPRQDPAHPRYRVRANLRLFATGRQQQWSLGAKLYSVSADLIADVSVYTELEFRSQVVSTEDRKALRILPHVDVMQVRLQHLSLRRVSHVKGSIARDMGNAFEPLIKRAIRKKGADLAGKINSKIQKKPERFELPAGLLGFLGGAPQEGIFPPATQDPAKSPSPSE